MENKHGEDMMQNDLYSKAKVNKTKYQGGKFEGNEIQKIINTFHTLIWPNNHPFACYSKLFSALKTTNEFVFTVTIVNLRAFIEVYVSFITKMYVQTLTNSHSMY